MEMMIVLSIIALIFLLTLPNIQQKEDIIRKKGCEALVEVVNAQILLYEIDHLVPPTNISQLIKGGYLKRKSKALSRWRKHSDSRWTGVCKIRAIH